MVTLPSTGAVRMFHHSWPALRSRIEREGLSTIKPDWQDQPAAVYLVEHDSDGDLAWGRDMWSVDCTGLELHTDPAWPRAFYCLQAIEPGRLELIEAVEDGAEEWDGPRTLSLALELLAHRSH